MREIGYRLRFGFFLEGRMLNIFSIYRLYYKISYSEFLVNVIVIK